ncbi:RNA-binding protein [Prochlorococcus sp. ALOHA_ZT_50]|uniref:RNA recognition motif domain-containing protein n=1 Tax=Prochlorococcus sp. ALOHA_ZT_50 TaxID=2919303 RepID=UPI002579A980|nr:RNA-binding protein [Prochlorococcus sp. ALOHA_ZT_50]MCH2079036.1 RNA-binding protein [Prochlorococcus sp. ALOHA_ZT_50]
MSIFVGNLPFRAEREDVIQLFAPFGEVLNCSLPLERDTGRKRGFAFIEMADEAIESTAIDGLQGTELMGRPLRINKAEPRGSGGSRRGGRGGYGGGGNNGGYGAGKNGSNSSNANKSSGAEGWEDRSYGNSSDNSEYENGRSRRKRGVSNESNASNETN